VKRVVEREKRKWEKTKWLERNEKKSFFFALQSEFKVKLWKSTMKERERSHTDTRISRIGIGEWCQLF
jgi:hypothetical protein